MCKTVGKVNREVQVTGKHQHDSCAESRNIMTSPPSEQAGLLPLKVVVNQKTITRLEDAIK